MGRIALDVQRRSGKVLLIALGIVTLLSIGITILTYIVLNADAHEARAARIDTELARQRADEDRQRAEAAKQKADDERQRAEAETKKARADAQKEHLEATRLRATLALDRGLTQCEQGEA